MLKKIKQIIYSIGLLLGRCIYNNRDSKVLYYHDLHRDGEIPDTIMSTPLSLFKLHLNLIRNNGFEIVDVITKSKNQILITFDDGYFGVYKNRDFFESEQILPTIFIITNKIGHANFMNLDELKTLKFMGFRIQSHTHTHPDLNLENNDGLIYEFNTSKIVLEDLLLNNINEICFPKGLFNLNVVKYALESGYELLFSSIPGSFFEKNRYNIVFRNLVQHANKFNFKCILFGGLSIYKGRYLKQQFHES